MKMARKKQLNVTGSQLISFSWINDLEITTNEDGQTTYSYKISKDTRVPNLDTFKELLINGLLQAKENGNRVTIKEYPERMYLFITIKQILDQQQVTGTRL